MKVYGPYLRKDGRKHIVIKHDDGKLQTKSYPKYLLEQKLGRELTEDETCDHDDENFTNDDPDNLKVLSRAENAKKSAPTTEWYYFHCPICEDLCRKPMRDVRGNWKKGKSGPFCSKSCAGKYSQTLRVYEES